jgi:hypothetical protein
VAAISVYGYFALALIGRQFPNKNNDEKEIIDLYVPVFTILQFLFYVGWLKVGEDLMFPFGVDDEDFEFNYILERNVEIGYLIADDLHMQLPPIYVEQLKETICLQHTNGSRDIVNHPPKEHVSTKQLTEWEMTISDGQEATKSNNRISSVIRNCLMHRRENSFDDNLRSFTDFSQKANGPLKKQHRTDSVI